MFPRPFHSFAEHPLYEREAWFPDPAMQILKKESEEPVDPLPPASDEDELKPRLNRPFWPTSSPEFRRRRFLREP